MAFLGFEYSWLKSLILFPGLKQERIEKTLVDGQLHTIRVWDKKISIFKNLNYLALQIYN